MTTASTNQLQTDKRVAEAFLAGANSYVPKWNEVFVTHTPERVNEMYTIVKTGNTVDEVSDGAAYPDDNVVELGSNTITQKIYKAQVNMGDLADLFDNYGRIMQTATSKGKKFAYKMDSLAVGFLNNATSTTAPYGVNVGSGSTVALVSTTSPIGDTGSTQSNRQTGALDKDTLNSAYVLLMNMKDHDGNIGGYQPRRLVVSSNEFMNGWQLTRSAGEPDSANNNDNWVKSLNLQLIVWPLLTASTCFLLADKSEAGARGLRYEIKELPKMRKVTSEITGTTVYQFRMVLAPGLADYLGVVSINV